MSPDDYAEEQAIEQILHDAAVNEATEDQSIVVLVEGESEMQVPALLSKFCDLTKIGVRFGSYGGAANLPIVLRLLNDTLQFNRPVIITYDNDSAGRAAIKKAQNNGTIKESWRILPIPCIPAVVCDDGKKGGSFEESFPLDIFISALFYLPCFPIKEDAIRFELENSIHDKEHWLNQVKRFCIERCNMVYEIKKPLLSQIMVELCDTLPITYTRLIESIKNARSEFPVQVGLKKLPDIPWRKGRRPTGNA